MQELVGNYIKFQVGPSDCVAISNAYKASAEHDLIRVLEVDEKLYAMKLVKEFRECSTKIGRNFLETIVQFSPTRFINDFMMAIVEGRTPGNYAVSFGIASQSFNIPLKNALQAMLYSFTVGMMGAAMRLGITNHTEAQGTIHSLKPTIRRVVGENMDKQVSSMYAFVPMIDIAGMIHQRLENRMFMS